MNDELSIPHSFDGTVRLFPLPNVVLFPQVMLPLHVFEQRYQQMTGDALAGDHLITMVLLKPGGETESEDKPPLCSIGCLGRIVADQRLKNGRYNVLLRGLNRVRILEELAQDKLYRSARVELLSSTAVPDLEIKQAYREGLTRAVTTWLSGIGVGPDQLAMLLKSDLPLEALGDLLSFALPLSVEFKQELLEELNAERRLKQLIHFLDTNQPPKPTIFSGLKFPPEFSAN